MNEWRIPREKSMFNGAAFGLSGEWNAITTNGIHTELQILVIR